MILAADIGNGNIKLFLNSNHTSYRLYQPNLGVKKTLKELIEKLIHNRPDLKDITVKAIGLTGAGRHYTNSFLLGTVKTEILCQYKAILELNPEVNSILEIGKEDSKIIILRNKIIDYFSLNTICSGGVGNYIENICFRFNLTLEEFDSLALQSEKPVNIGSKCAVFGLSSALNYLQKGEDIKNIVAGVIKAVARNCLSMVKGRQITSPCIFTGGGALLKSFKKAFEEELGFEVIIPENPIFTGAYGASLYAKEDKNLSLEEILSLCYT